MDWVSIDGDATHFSSCDRTTLKNTYFSSLKSTKISNFSLSKEIPFNTISFVYEINYSWGNKYNDGKGGNGTAWFNISANNLVKYPDGSIKWGLASIGAYDFTSKHSTKGLEDCVSTTITVNMTNYNITQIN